jgi:LysR family glycine cleavage system transcriptional activator
MRIRSPSLPELHAFVASARLGSLAKAAQALYVTPGAVSRAISRIEEQFGQALFVRQGRNSQLTDEGWIYFEAIASAIDTLESAAMRAQVSSEAATLQLSMTPTLASHWFIRRWPDFQRRHPEITLTFVPYRRDEFPVVSSQGASLRGGDGAWPAGVEGDYVVGREIVPVCRPQDLAQMEPISSPCDLMKRPLLFHTLYPRTWATWFEGVGCTCQGLTPSASFEQVSQLLEAAASGVGFALVQRCLIDDYLAAGKLVIAYPKRVMNDRAYYLCYPETLRRSPAVIALRVWLQEQGREHELSSESGEPGVAR